MNDRSRPAKAAPEVIAATNSSIALIGDVSRQIGWESCWQAIQAAGEDVARTAGMARWWHHPRWVELQKRRDPDHQPCSRRKPCNCSRCTHAASWASRGGRPYLGVDAEARRSS